MSFLPPITTVAELEDQLSAPSPGAVETLRRLPGDIILLGVAGKMGPTLARMARRAADLAGNKRRVIGVSRFSSVGQRAELERYGVETIACDLLDAAAVEKLPDAPHIVYLAGMKFGATGQEALTWAMNTHLPAIVCERYRASRIVAFSTGNVYGLVPVTGGGSVEADALAPLGEYAMSCLGRERMFEHFSRVRKIPTALIRLNYACELRYGVLVDVAQRIWAGLPVPLEMGYLNTLWQADANAMTLEALAHVGTPPFLLNLTGPELVRVRTAAEQLGELLGKPVHFSGTEAPTALLNNAQKCFGLFGQPRVGVEQLLRWIAHWVRHDGVTLGKPTHFEARDGKF